ncbi:hypothetical protein wVul_0117 [Wolbachia endosymbiont of Armadillidium vulgare str. wVulC]|nr:hypothetical protein wVul_0116 [Wolbachia endosymbiont of Armadillidium vulgare str. wVulC]KLT22914.1 hypothetical protein wVul_0117 [Wolbachia endosymbiont of Armadillidium vulgare str. wVulC]
MTLGSIFPFKLIKFSISLPNSLLVNFLGSQCQSTQLYERCNVTRCCIINDVIPVRDTGIQFLLYSYLVYLFKIKFSGSQCQSTGMTLFLAEIILKSQCSYSCGSSFVVQFHQKCCIACLFAIKFSRFQCQALE